MRARVRGREGHAGPALRTLVLANDSVVGVVVGDAVLAAVREGVATGLANDRRPRAVAVVGLPGHDEPPNLVARWVLNSFPWPPTSFFENRY